MEVGEVYTTLPYRVKSPYWAVEWRSKAISGGLWGCPVCGRLEGHF